jgi:hypothetical protein
MSAEYRSGVCGCGDVGVVFEMTDALWLEFFSGTDFERPQDVAGCAVCRVEWAQYAGPLVPAKQTTDKERAELENAGRAWSAAKDDERAAMATLYAAVVAAHAAGVSEVEAARLAGVDRMTVRRALGKL